MAGTIAVPVVGAANATAVAGGLELLLGCDVIVASSAAQFGLPEVQARPLPGRRRHLPRHADPAGVALELTLTGDPIDADRAYDARAGQRTWSCRPTCAHRRSRYAERIAANGPLGAAGDQGAGPAGVTDPAGVGERLRRLADAGVQQRGRQGGRGRVRREARAGLAGPSDGRARRGVPRATARPRSCAVEEVDVAAARRRAGPGRACSAASVNFPDVLIVAGEYQIKVPPPFVPGSEFAGVVAEVARRTSTGRVGRRPGVRQHAGRRVRRGGRRWPPPR